MSKSQATSIAQGGSKRKTPIRPAEYADFSFPRAVGSANAIVRYTDVLDNPNQVSREFAKVGVTSSALDYLLCLFNGEVYRAELNPLRYTPEDRRRRRDNRFWETESKLLEQPTNNALHRDTIEHEWRQAESDLLKDDIVPQGRYKEYRARIKCIVEAELHARLQAGSVNTAMTVAVVNDLLAWLEDDNSIPDSTIDEFCLMAVTAPLMFRHVKSPADIGPQPKVIADMMGRHWRKTAVNQRGYETKAQTQNPPQNAQVHVPGQAFVQDIPIPAQAAGEAQQPLKVTIDIKTKGGKGKEVETMNVSHAWGDNASATK